MWSWHTEKNVDFLSMINSSSPSLPDSSIPSKQNCWKKRKVFIRMIKLELASLVHKVSLTSNNVTSNPIVYLIKSKNDQVKNKGKLFD